MATDPPSRSSIADHRRPGMKGWKKALLGLAALGATMVIGVTVGGYYLYQRYDGKVDRAQLLPAPAAADRARTEQNWSGGPLNLLLGSDSRAGEAGGAGPIGERSDTIMLVHISRDRSTAAIVSIPRDSYVDVPAAGSWKGGKNKINAAFAYGGAPLAATTVRNLTGVPLDGALVADFAGIRDLVDAVGGVRVCVPYTVRSTFSATVWQRGCHEMDGDRAEEFMRQRHEVPGGDFGRMYNQQLVVKAVIAKVSAKGLLTDPLAFDDLMVTAAGALTVDRDLDLTRLARAVRGIRPAAIRYATAPYSSADLKTFAGSAVQLDPKRSAVMFAALRDDTIDAWLAAHPQKLPTG